MLRFRIESAVAGWCSHLVDSGSRLGVSTLGRSAMAEEAAVMTVVCGRKGDTRREAANEASFVWMETAQWT